MSDASSQTPNSAFDVAQPQNAQESGPRSSEYSRVLERYLARLVQLNEVPQALGVLRREIDHNPDDPGLYERLAEFLAAKQSYRGAGTGLPACLCPVFRSFVVQQTRAPLSALSTIFGARRPDSGRGKAIRWQRPPNILFVGRWQHPGHVPSLEPICQRAISAQSLFRSEFVECLSVPRQLLIGPLGSR